MRAQDYKAAYSLGFYHEHLGRGIGLVTSWAGMAERPTNVLIGITPLRAAVTRLLPAGQASTTCANLTAIYRAVRLLKRGESGDEQASEQLRFDMLESCEEVKHRCAEFGEGLTERSSSPLK